MDTRVVKERLISVSDVPVVFDFPDVFCEDLPGVSSERQMELWIDLVLRAAPFSKALYRITLSEMHELCL